VPLVKLTKTNRFTLIATILLGVLLYTIIRFAEDLNVAWDGGKLKPPPVITPANNDVQPPEFPRIATTNDLRAILDRQVRTDIDTNAMIAGYSEWSDARGFTGRNQLFIATDSDRSDPVTTSDADRLRALSDAGDADASQALADNRVFDDLFGAIELYRRAAEQGSTFALLRIGSVLESLDIAGARPAAADTEQLRLITDLTERGVGNSLQLTALGYVLTAIRDGGAPIIDYPLLEWLDRLNDTTTADERAAACEWSERTLLDIARVRARWQNPAITTKPPPVFFAIPDLANRLPCNKTSFPIENLLDLTRCTTTPVRNAEDEALDLYLCLSDSKTKKFTD
jgi:hypothetical protein